MMDNTFLKKWMILRQQRELAQDPSGLPHDHSHKSQGHSEVKQVQGHTIGKRTGKNHLEKIQPMSEDQQYRHKNYGSIITFGAPFHIDQDRSQEVDDQVEVKGSDIGAFEADLEINGLFGDIRVPDQHELREPQIGPEDRKGELEFTQVMQMFFVDVFQVT